MAFSWYPGKCNITWTHSPEPLILQTKDGPKRALSEICKDITPECYLNPFLFNAFLQTAWTATKDLTGPPIHYKRRVFSSEDPAFAGHFTVDFVVEPPTVDDEAGMGVTEDPTGIGARYLPERTTYFTNKEFEHLPSDDTKPLLVVLHGLSGGSYEVYLRHVLEKLVAQTALGKEAGGLSGGNWEALVVNSRGCAGSKITSSILYNARATWDTRQVVKWCRETFPNRPLFGIGYSLGANILTNYIAEEGEDCLLRAAVVVSNPWNLELSSEALKRSYFGLNVYSRAMGSAMRKLFEKHKDQITANVAVNVEKIRSIKYLHEFDREVQCATWGYPTEGAYYRDASSTDSVFAIRIPVLALHARDDPIASDEAVPYDEIRQNPYVVLCATSGGGHLAWNEFWGNAVGGSRWHPKPSIAFLNAMAKDIHFEKTEKPAFAYKGPQGGHETPFVFEPMRRKLHMRTNQK